MDLESDSLGPSPATHGSRGKLLMAPSLSFPLLKMEITEVFMSRALENMKYL